jgi:hypothetical protein
MKRILSQLRDNSVALTSILIALTSLAYNAWRYERTEHMFLSHYDRDATNGNPRTGWTYVIVINDFASVLPEPVGVRAGRLRDTWREQWEGLMQDDDTAVDRIEVDIAALREGTLDTLRSLR